MKEEINMSKERDKWVLEWTPENYKEWQKELLKKNKRLEFFPGKVVVVDNLIQKERPESYNDVLIDNFSHLKF